MRWALVWLASGCRPSLSSMVLMRAVSTHLCQALHDLAAYLFVSSHSCHAKRMLSKPSVIACSCSPLLPRTFICAQCASVKLTPAAVSITITLHALLFVAMQCAVLSCKSSCAQAESAPALRATWLPLDWFPAPLQTHTRCTTTC